MQVLPTKKVICIPQWFLQHIRFSDTTIEHKSYFNSDVEALEHTN